MKARWKPWKTSNQTQKVEEAEALLHIHIESIINVVSRSAYLEKIFFRLEKDGKPWS